MEPHISQRHAQNRAKQPEYSTIRILFGYLISIANTVIYFSFLSQTHLPITLLSQTTPFFTFVTLSCFAVSCSLGFYLLVSGQSFTENDKIIAFMTSLGFIGWFIVFYQLWSYYDNIFFAFLVAFWSFLSFGMFVGIIWPRNVGWRGGEVIKPKKVHDL